MNNNCKLCDLPIHLRPITDNDNVFCCHGCLSVFNTFGPQILENSNQTKQYRPVKPKSDEMETYLKIDGMHCSSCEVLIKKLAEMVEGISYVSTNYATSSARVIYKPKVIKESDLVGKLSFAGYKAYSYKDQNFERSIESDRSLLKTIIAATLAGIVMMLNIAFFYPLDLGLVSMEELKPLAYMNFYIVPRVMFFFTSILIFTIGMPIMRGAYIGIRALTLNMDNLLAIAILSAYGYSVVQMFMGGIDYYFDVSSMIVGVVSVGRYFEHTAKINATSELNTIINNWSLSEVHVIRNGIAMNVQIEDLKPQDIVLIKEGEVVPVNGEIVIGQAAIDESLITGEPFPVSRTIGDKVLGGVTIVEGEVQIATGDEIVSQVENLSHIFRSMQSSASGSTSIVDRIARIFVPLVLLLAFTVTAIMLINGIEVTFALLAGMTTLIVSCPCTFGLATPLTIAHTISKALESKIIFISGDIFEKNNKYSTIAFDKTGTLSAGKMSIIDVIGESDAIDKAAAIEHQCTHPIAKVISELGPKADLSNLEIHPGKGASADIGDLTVVVGSKELINLFGWEITPDIKDSIEKYKTDKYVISYVGWEGKAHGAIVTQDQHRPELETFIKALRVDQRIVLLTGSEHSSGYEKYVDECYTGITPEAKEAVIRQLRNNGENIIMVGDGSNDAPALASADLGIAFGVPTALAAEAADIVIPGKDLNRVQSALNLISSTKRRIRQNISWAFLYNAIAIPLALTGQLNPLLAALAMTSSSLLVVWNSSRPLVGEVSSNEN